MQYMCLQWGAERVLEGPTLLQVCATYTDPSEHAIVSDDSGSLDPRDNRKNGGWVPFMSEYSGQYYFFGPIWSGMKSRKHDLLVLEGCREVVWLWQDFKSGQDAAKCACSNGEKQIIFLFEFAYVAKKWM